MARCCGALDRGGRTDPAQLDSKHRRRCLQLPDLHHQLLDGAPDAPTEEELEFKDGKKKTVMARWVHNDRLIDALSAQAFAALTGIAFEKAPLPSSVPVALTVQFANGVAKLVVVSQV